MIYKYENLKTKAQIDVNISKKYSFIYGPNGTGKTTFARSIDNNKEIIVDGIKKKHLVFSQDFVNNNIYISTSDSGYKSDTKNRSRLKQIFLGNTSKEDNETLNKLRTKKREYNKELIQPDIFKSEFKNIVRELLKEDKEYNEDYEKFIMNYVDDKILKKYTEKLQNIMENEKIEVDITKIDDEEYISKLELPEIKKTYTEEEVKEELINFLAKSEIENIICLPKTGEYIKEGLKVSKKNVVYKEKLEEAVDFAKKVTKKGSVCLLSPAASSYGYFKNFEERGRLFKKYVNEK